MLTRPENITEDTPVSQTPGSGITLEHSPLGGSGAERWFNCAGSFLLHRELLENGEFENLSSEFADVGTAAHELAARCLIEEREPYEFIGQEINGYKVGEAINPDAVAVYVNICRGTVPPDGTGVALVEQTIHLPELHPLLQGTVDFAHWGSRKGIDIIDYKNGEGVVVDAVNNKQGLYYAFLLIADNAWLRDSASDDMPVRIRIVQPNARGLFSPEAVWETTVGYVQAWGRHDLLPRMHALTTQRDMSDDDFVPGDHCQFCPVLLECPKAQAAFHTFASGTEFPDMLTNDEVDTFLAQKDLARRFMNDLDKVAYARAIGGHEFQNGKLVAKKANREWRPDAEKVLVAALGEAAYEKKLRSPAQVEKLSSRGKDLAQEWGYKPTAEGLSFVTLSDDRPAVKPKGNEDVFKSFAKKLEDAGW